MSRENVEVVWKLFERWNSGDHTAPTEYLDPSVELETPFSSVSGEPYRGHAGVEEWIRDLDEQFSVWRYCLDDVREVGNAVIAIGSVYGRGRGSGIEFDQPSALVVDFGTSHRITRVRIHLDVDAALEAVGLAE
jgi:ketosteroid isomerase-like protein